MPKILLVDDQEFNHILLKDIFENEDYEFIDAFSGEEALKIINDKENKIDMVLLDLQMPGTNGLDVLKSMNGSRKIKEIPVVVITGDTDKETERKCLELSASDFISKPFNAPIVRKRVSNVITLSAYQKSLEEKVNEQTTKIRKFNGSLLDLLGVIVEYRDSESGNHVYRVKNYTKVLAEELNKLYPEYGLTKKQIQDITNASVLHDLGKIAIPDSILLKPGRLTHEEFEIMKTHAAKGAELIERAKDLWDPEFFEVAYQITRHHHEKYDGNGYPDKLKGEQIPIAAQIVSIADVFDALVSDRVYKKACSPETARDMITGNECGVFSDKLLRCFRNVFDEFKEISINLK